MLRFKGEKFESSFLAESENKETLYKCLVFSDNLIVAFHKEHVHLHDENLKCHKRIAWNKIIRLNVTSLQGNSITSNHTSCEEKGFICSV